MGPLPKFHKQRDAPRWLRGSSLIGMDTNYSPRQDRRPCDEGRASQRRDQEQRPSLPLVRLTSASIEQVAPSPSVRAKPGPLDPLKLLKTIQVIPVDRVDRHPGGFGRSQAVELIRSITLGTRVK